MINDTKEVSSSKYDLVYGKMVVIDSWWKPRYCIGLYEPILYADNTSDSLISKSIDFNKQLAIDKLNTRITIYLFLPPKLYIVVIFYHF